MRLNIGRYGSFELLDVSPSQKSTERRICLTNVTNKKDATNLINYPDRVKKGATSEEYIKSARERTATDFTTPESKHGLMVIS